MTTCHPGNYFLRCRSAILVCVFFLVIPVALAQQVMVAAASDLVYCLDELNREFRRINPKTNVIASVGSSGTFFAQIRNGAPFDVYMSADMSFPQRLIAENAADADSLMPYAIGRIVVWTLRDDLDVKGGLGRLTDPRIGRIAIANPDHAPYGRAAKAAMEKSGIWKALEPKIVYGENISQARQYVQTGNADAGIIALSLVMAPHLRGIGKFEVVPEDLHPRLEQGAVLTLQGAANPAAREYIEFLRGQRARRIFERYGFVLPAQ